MKIVTIDKSLMLKYAGDPEILQKDNIPLCAYHQIEI